MTQKQPTNPYESAAALGGLADFITGKQSMADELGLSVRTMERHEQDPEDPFPKIVVGGLNFYHIPSVRAWLLRRQNVPAVTTDTGQPPHKQPVKRGRGRPRKIAEGLRA